MPPPIELRLDEPATMRSLPLVVRAPGMDAGYLVLKLPHDDALPVVLQAVVELGGKLLYVSAYALDDELRTYLVAGFSRGQGESALKQLKARLEREHGLEVLKAEPCWLGDACVVSQRFPAVLEDGRRVVVMDLDSLLQMISAVGRLSAGIMPVTLYGQGEAVGALWARKVKEFYPNLDHASQVRLCLELYRALGLGSAVEVSTSVYGTYVEYRVRIRDNWERGGEGCHITRGILAGVFREILGTHFTVVEEKHNSDGECTFLLRAM